MPLRGGEIAGPAGCREAGRQPAQKKELPPQGS
jgi:hypothetical protein